MWTKVWRLRHPLILGKGLILESIHGEQLIYRAAQTNFPGKARKGKDRRRCNLRTALGNVDPTDGQENFRQQKEARAPGLAGLEQSEKPYAHVQEAGNDQLPGDVGSEPSDPVSVPARSP
ncbi:hypothetical protein PoB_001051200 [Plakobranchus ocellatus]|uniref:Uncharacterized protein n=1 Tax=Plakobranchus ocellatus TaxID=259542 RepID=A0AAV3YPF0_9GAST|nr:hypothetical protein PoB_001051200 [Plakobranchus ocellatus]